VPVALYTARKPIFVKYAMLRSFIIPNDRLLITIAREDGMEPPLAKSDAPDDVIQEVVDVLVAHGYPPPEGGIRPVDPDYVPAY
jgi:hypothetical protein